MMAFLQLKVCKNTIQEHTQINNPISIKNNHQIKAIYNYINFNQCKIRKDNDFKFKYSNKRAFYESEDCYCASPEEIFYFGYFQKEFQMNNTKLPFHKLWEILDKESKLSFLLLHLLIYLRSTGRWCVRSSLQSWLNEAYLIAPPLKIHPNKKTKLVKEKNHQALGSNISLEVPSHKANYILKDAEENFANDFQAIFDSLISASSQESTILVIGKFSCTSNYVIKKLSI